MNSFFVFRSSEQEDELRPIYRNYILRLVNYAGLKFIWCSRMCGSRNLMTLLHCSIQRKTSDLLTGGFWCITDIIIILNMASKYQLFCPELNDQNQSHITIKIEVNSYLSMAIWCCRYFTSTWLKVSSIIRVACTKELSLQVSYHLSPVAVLTIWCCTVC